LCASTTSCDPATPINKAVCVSSCQQINLKCSSIGTAAQTDHEDFMFACCTMYRGYDIFFQSENEGAMVKKNGGKIVDANIDEKGSVVGDTDWFVAVQGHSLANSRRTDSYLLSISFVDQLSDSDPLETCSSQPDFETPGPTGTAESLLFRQGRSGGMVGSGSKFIQNLISCIGISCYSDFDNLVGEPAVANGIVQYGEQRLYKWVRPKEQLGWVNTVVNITLLQLEGGGGGLKLSVRSGSSMMVPASSVQSDSAVVSGIPGKEGVWAASISVTTTASAELWILVEGLSPVFFQLHYHLSIFADHRGLCWPPIFNSNQAQETNLPAKRRLDFMTSPISKGRSLILEVIPQPDLTAGQCLFGSRSGPPQPCIVGSPQVWSGISFYEGSERCDNCLVLQGWRYKGLSSQDSAASPLTIKKLDTKSVRYEVFELSLKSNAHART
jgi:hypothetical protein